MTKLMSEGTVVNRKLNSIDSAIPINRYSDSNLYIGRFHSKDSTIYLKLGLSLKTILTLNLIMPKNMRVNFFKDNWEGD